MFIFVKASEQYAFPLFQPAWEELHYQSVCSEAHPYPRCLCWDHLLYGDRRSFWNLRTDTNPEMFGFAPILLLLESGVGSSEHNPRAVKSR